MLSCCYTIYEYKQNLFTVENQSFPVNPEKHVLTETSSIIGTSPLKDSTKSAIQTHKAGKTLWRSNSVYICAVRKSKAAIVFLQDAPLATCRLRESKINAVLKRTLVAHLHCQTFILNRRKNLKQALLL